MTEDIREVRQQVDGVANLARRLFDLPSGLTQVVAGIVRAMPVFFSRKSHPSSWIDSLLPGIQSVLHLLGRPKASHPKEATHE